MHAVAGLVDFLPRMKQRMAATQLIEDLEYARHGGNRLAAAARVSVANDGSRRRRTSALGQVGCPLYLNRSLTGKSNG